MNTEMNPNDPRLDEALDAIRNETIQPLEVEAAAARVRQRLAAEAASGHLLETCADYQALLPDYRAGRLAEARVLLLKDHIRECVACRKALENRPAKVVAMTAKPRAAWRTWAMAAGVVVAAGLAGWATWNQFAGAGRDRVTVEAFNGRLYRVAGDQVAEVKAGETLGGGTEIRTAKDSGALLRLGDGSRVEMRERSALTVSHSGRDVTLKLDGGAVIVEAAKDRSRHLYVATRDARVAVTGTVFSVACGLKGSRVSVVEGEVRVTGAGQEQVLHAGDQVSSNPAVGAVPVEEDIAWSQNREKHIALLGEFATVAKKLEQVRMPDLRYQSRLLDAMPADTVIYASIPNLARPLAEAQQVIDSRVNESPALREWWQQANHGRQLDEMISAVRTFSEYLGDEIVIAAVAGPEGHPAPVFIAETKRDGFREFVEAEVSRHGGAGKVTFAGSADAIVAAGGPQFFLAGGRVAMSPDAGALRQVAAALQAGGATGFSATPFYARLARSYRDGAGFLFSADLERLMASAKRPAPKVAGALWGNVQNVVLEQKEYGGRSEIRAALSFRGQRAGIASWLGNPAAMSVLDFFSPETTLATALVLKNPAALVDELFTALAAKDPKFTEHLAEVERELGIDIRRDLAGALGGEVAVALDGPMLPVPSWKAVAEVVDQGRLQYSIQKMVDAANRKMAANGQAGVVLQVTVDSGRTYYTLSAAKTGGTPLEAHYTFFDGYLVAGPTRQVVDAALQVKQSGLALPRTQSFRDLLPRDRQSGMSGIVYQNLGKKLAPVAAVLPEDQKKAFESIAGDLKPLLIALYAETDNITIAANGNLLGMTLNQLLTMQGPMSLLHTRQGTSARQNSYR